MDNNTTSFPPINESPEPPIFPLDYRIIATALHVIIFLCGVVGNVLVVVVVLRKKSMHIPTYCYLVSLAMADVLVIFVSLPEAIASYHLYAGQYVLGQVGCSLSVFSQFLGINASSLSILAFTVERYIAICHPLRAKSICTLKRAKKIIIGLWIVACVSAAPWLGLTIAKPHPSYPKIMEICDFRVKPDKYIYLFGSDIFLFYSIPLVVASVLYFKIGLVLRKSSRSDSVFAKSMRASVRSKASVRLRNGSPVSGLSLDKRSSCTGEPPSYDAASEAARKAADRSLRQSRIKVIRMLLVIVILFAVLWLPYRGLSLYNCFAALVGSRPIYNKWLMLFAKTCIFLNSSINPILYNALSKRFRQAFKDILCGEGSEKSTASVIDACHSSKSLLSSRGISPSPSPSYNSKELWTESGHHNSFRSHLYAPGEHRAGMIPLTPSPPKKRKPSVVFLEPLLLNNGCLKSPPSPSTISSQQRHSH